MIILVVGFLLSYFLPYLLNIPSGEDLNIRWLFIWTVLAFVVTTMGSSFAVSSWTQNRLDLRNYLLVANQLLRVVVVVIIFLFSHPSVSQVGFGLTFAALITLLGDLILWRKLTPQLFIKISSFDKSRIRTLFSMGGWMVVNQAGTILFLNIDILVVNIFIGPVEAGKYGSVLLFSLMLRNLASRISTVFTPFMVNKYASKDYETMKVFSVQVVRLMGIAMALPVGLLCALAKPVLELWLGSSFGELSFLLVIMLFHLPINLAVLPLFGLQVTLKKVKWPGIVTLLTGIVNYIVAIIFVKYFKLGMLGVALAGALVLTIKNAVFTPLYGASIQEVKKLTYLVPLIPGVPLAALIATLAWFMSLLIPIHNLLSLIEVTLIIGGSYFLFIFSCLLTKQERQVLINFIASKGIKKAAGHETV